MRCSTAASAKHDGTNEMGLLPVQSRISYMYLSGCVSASRLTLALPMRSTWGLTKKLSCCYQDFSGNFIFPTQTLGTKWSLENLPSTSDMQLLPRFPLPRICSSPVQSKQKATLSPCSQALCSFSPPGLRASSLVTENVAVPDESFPLWV